MIEDFRLRVFAQVAQLGSFTAAARALGVSQPAVSQHIAELEKYAGGQLFERGRGSVRLTARGRTFLAHAEEILAGYRSLDNEFHVPETTLLRHVQHEGRPTCILIRHGRFEDLDAPADTPADCIVEAEGTAILPSFFNTHTHAAMTLLRGQADDLPLQEWLEEHVWPAEARLQPEDIRQGNELAIKEMTASGTTFFSDMYFDPEEAVAAVEASGMRAAIGITVLDGHPKSQAEALKDYIKNWQDPTGGRIQLVMCPHSVYTVGPARLRRCADFARHHGMLLHIHLAETRKEVEDCIRDHGTTPVRYLEKLGFLDRDVIAAHCVHVDAEEWKILARRGVTVAHCPCSNMKLGSGRFPYELALESGCRITLGTDGASSNNSLDLREEMKFAALLAKLPGDTSLLSAEEVFRWATRNGAGFFGIDAGRIAVGAQADAVLLDLSHPKLQPGRNLVSDWVYSADSACIRYTLCAGRILK
ncbi:MAG: amidohydrolase family protein [Bacteroidales bacterium]|jgi:5-methylthioadenosine/S-adenosylhomocysteine deaminase|nr:amidohydrolase family protein [Bacteroidales bacterium]